MKVADACEGLQLKQPEQPSDVFVSVKRDLLTEVDE